MPFSSTLGAVRVTISITVQRVKITYAEDALITRRLVVKKFASLSDAVSIAAVPEEISEGNVSQTHGVSSWFHFVPSY